MHAGMNAGVRLYDLSRLEDLLQCSKIVMNLLSGILREQLGDGRADGASRGRIADIDPDAGTAAARCALEAHGPGVVHIGVLERTP